MDTLKGRMWEGVSMPSPAPPLLAPLCSATWKLSEAIILPGFYRGFAQSLTSFPAPPLSGGGAGALKTPRFQSQFCDQPPPRSPPRVTSLEHEALLSSRKLQGTWELSIRNQSPRPTIRITAAPSCCDDSGNSWVSVSAGPGQTTGHVLWAHSSFPAAPIGGPGFRGGHVHDPNKRTSVINKRNLEFYLSTWRHAF